MRLTLVITLFALLTPAFAAVTGWRADGTGRFPTAVPLTKWSSTEGAVWATELPSWSNALPVLVGDRIIVNSEPSTLICLDKDGKILWQRTNTYEDLLTDEEKAKLTAENAQFAPLDKQEKELNRQLDDLNKAVKQADDNLKAKPDDDTLKTTFAGAKDAVAKQQAQLNEVRKQKAALTLAERYRVPITHPSNGYTSDTPVTDGARIYATYGNGVVACYALDGTRQWARIVEKPTHVWGHSCSPVLVGNMLVVQIIDMFALDAATGREIWRRKQGHIWGTSAVVHIGNQDVLFTDTGDIVNAADGKSLATTGFHMDYGSPMLIGDTVYCASGKNAAAFQLSTKTDGGVQTTKLWQTEVANDRYYASPLLDNGLLYVLNAAGVLSVLDVKTGEKQYEQKLALGGCSYPSPVLAGNLIILSSDTGKSVLITPGRTYQEVSRCTLESFRSTPTCDGKRIYIRTLGGKSKLYCLGSKD